jgi:Domain of unknown function (DUF4149)
MSFLRFLILLALVLWLGSLMFFPLVASTAFSTLPSPHQAGMVVRNCLRSLHWIGFVSGLVFLASSLLFGRLTSGRTNWLRLSHVLILVMLALTAISEFRIIPRMDRVRASVGEIAALAPGDPTRVQFDSLHRTSTRIETVVLVCGVLVLYLTSRRLASRHAS